MCGIAGGLTTADPAALQALVARIVDSQRNRGPDAQRVANYPAGQSTVVLGHNRLAIIAPGPDSDQPFDDGRFVISFNGEIYNYVELRDTLSGLGCKFRTASDTEVLLAGFATWGEAVFAKLIGMFAVAIFDRQANSLTLARDRFGKKPLFVRATERRMVFASSVQEIGRTDELAPNLAYALRGITLKYYEDETEISPLVGLEALPAGTGAVYRADNGRISVRRFRHFDLRVATEVEADRIAGWSEQRLESELVGLATSAVNLRLRADVPVGIALSGGVDSSLIAGISARGSADMRAFSFADPTDLDSEGPLVAEVAAQSAMPVDYVWPEKPADIDRLFWATLAAQGAPFPHVSMMAQYAVYERARATGVKVLLGGQGGDEAFMGYRKFFLFWAQDALRARRMGDFPALLRATLPLLPPVLKRASLFWGERRRYSGDVSGMGTRLKISVSASGVSPALATDQSLRDRQALDLLRYSLPSLLRYEDRNSMANSIESRLPLCDHRLVTFGLALPIGLKLRDGYGKYLLRRASRGYIPENVRTLRDKRGFDVRQDRWIAAGLGRTIRDKLDGMGSRLQPFVPPGETLATLFSDQALASDPRAFREATTLLWFADPYRSPSVAGVGSMTAAAA